MPLKVGKLLTDQLSDKNLPSAIQTVCMAQLDSKLSMESSPATSQ